MARTGIIKEEERNRLCQLVASKYKNDQSYDYDLKLNAYLPNYSHLREQIQIAVPDMATSISDNRLRKLFYQKKNSEDLTFGLDFIDALYLYATGKDRDTYFQGLRAKSKVRNTRSFRIPILGIALVFISLIIWRLFLTEDSTGTFELPLEEEFHTVNSEDLKQRGWDILNYDSDWFAKQDSQGFLALYTLPGGYWVKPGEEIKITNTLTRPIGSATRRLKLSLGDFTPEERWQGVSLILFDKDHSGRNGLIYSYSYNIDGGGGMFNAYYVKSGVPYGKIIINPTSGSGYSSIHLGVEWKENTLVINAGRGNLWAPMDQIGELPLRFIPSYIGIAAYQGYTDDNGQPLNADTLSIYVDRIEIE